MKNNKQAAMAVLEHSPNMVHCRDDFYVFNDLNGMWECDNKFVLFKKILMNLEDKLVVYRSNESETGKPSNQSYGNTASLMNQVCSIMPSLTVDNHWYTRVNESGKMKLLFKDGIYDFKKGEWEEGFDPEISFFDSTPFNFPKRDEEVIKEVNKAFFETPFQNERLSTGVYFKRRLAKAIAGEYVKNIYFCLGQSNSGKSQCANMCKNAFGTYVDSFNAENYSSKVKDDEATGYRWAMLLRNKRLLFSQEVKMGTKLDGAPIKKITGGDPLVGRGHNKDESEFWPHFTQFVVGNDMPNITPLDEAIKDRVRCINFEKKFKEISEGEELEENELEIDLDFCTKIKSQAWKDAFVHVILDAYKDMKQNGDETPGDVSDAFNDWSKGYSLDERFDDDYEITQNETGTVTNKEFDSWRTENKIGKMSGKLWAQFMKKRGCEATNSGGRGWSGVRQRTQGCYNHLNT